MNIIQSPADFEGLSFGKVKYDPSAWINCLVFLGQGNRLWKIPGIFSLRKFLGLKPLCSAEQQNLQYVHTHVTTGKREKKNMNRIFIAAIILVIVNERVNARSIP